MLHFVQHDKLLLLDKIDELLTRGVANIIPNRVELEKILRSGKKLNVYLGIDPTAPKIHLGHAVLLRKLQQFVELGHQVTFLIGDFTALIGDASDKESERPVLTDKDIQTNFKTYKTQAEKLLDFGKVGLRRNSEWLSKLGFEDIIKLFQHFSLNDFIGRELIKKRLTQGGHIRLDEVAYPAMQGYDSYFLNTDIQIGGTDQTFNMQAGRILQKDLRSKESFIVAGQFLTGTDGRKMSKSWGNAVWLDDGPNEMLGKIMSISDELIVQYFTLATNAPVEKVKEAEERLAGGENPMVLKKELARLVVSELYNSKEAQKAEEEFERIFQGRGVPTAIPTFNLKTDEEIKIADLLLKTGLAPSRAEAKRLIEQGAVEYNKLKIKNAKLKIKTNSGDIIKVGKLKYLKLVV